MYLFTLLVKSHTFVVNSKVLKIMHFETQISETSVMSLIPLGRSRGRGRRAAVAAVAGAQCRGIRVIPVEDQRRDQRGDGRAPWYCWCQPDRWNLD